MTNDSDKSERLNKITRRKTVKSIGGLMALFSLPAGRVSAKESTSQTLSPDVSDYPGLKRANVLIFDEGKTRWNLEGRTQGDPNADVGYRLLVHDVRDAHGNYTPDQAVAEIVPVFGQEMARSNEKDHKPSQGSSGGKESGSNGKEVVHNNNYNISYGSDGGQDWEYDFEGGAYAATLDPINLTCALSESWLDWYYNNDTIGWNKWWWKATPYHLPTSKWEYDGATPTSPWVYGMVHSNLEADYYNWTWNDPNKITTAHHNLSVSGDVNGNIQWFAWGETAGENSSLLHFEGGVYSNTP